MNGTSAGFGPRRWRTAGRLRCPSCRACPRGRSAWWAMNRARRARSRPLPAPMIAALIRRCRQNRPPSPRGAGVLIHALLERLPDAPADMREGAGRKWLERHAPALSPEERDEMLARAIGVLNEPQWRDLFGPNALAEVPLAATVGTEVITGTVDRLLIEPQRIMVADFKTARRPPADLAGVPASTLRQMAAYVAALEVIYPGRRVEAAVLYTQTPLLLALPPETLRAHKPGLERAQETYPS